MRRPLPEEITAASDPRIVGKFLEAMQAAVEYGKRTRKTFDTICAREIVRRLQSIHSDLKKRGFDLMAAEQDIRRRLRMQKLQQDVLAIIKKSSEKEIASRSPGKRK